jgi:hypothetical protein
LERILSISLKEEKMYRKTAIMLLVSVFLFSIALSLTSAEIVINMPEKQAYNLGESVRLSGYVLPKEDFQGRFSIKLACPGEENELLK